MSHAPAQSYAHGARCTGFTLVELLCIVALLAIVATLAYPSFARLIQKYEVQQALMELKGALYVARSEAVRRSQDVKLRKSDSTDGRSCTGSPSDWSCGWIIFLDGNGNSSFEESATSGDELLRVFPGSAHASVKFTGNASVLTVNHWGAINGVAASFVISPGTTDDAMGSDSPLEMIVCVSSGGRVRSVPSHSCS